MKSQAATWPEYAASRPITAISELSAVWRSSTIGLPATIESTSSLCSRRYAAPIEPFVVQSSLPSRSVIVLPPSKARR
jgi:hypothetical protein